MTRGTQAILLVGLVLFLAARAKATPRGKAGALNPATGKPIVRAGTRRLSVTELGELVRSHGFAQSDKAAAIAQRESGRFADVVVDTRGMNRDQLRAYWGVPAAPELSVGLWQINLLANPGAAAGATLDDKVAALQDPDANAAAALKLSAGGTSWGPWGG